MTNIVLCELGHKNEYNLAMDVRKAAHWKNGERWRCKHEKDGEICGRGLLSIDSVIVLPGVKPPVM